MSDRMRSEFEVWAKSKSWDVSHNGQHYNHVYAYYAWIGWQASRAALVVELPRITGDAVYDGQEVHDALDNAGVSYK